MAQKGVNTLVVEAKEELTNAINKCLQEGIPAAMVSIMLESLLMDLNNNVKIILEKENKEYEESVSSEETVKYVDEDGNKIEQEEE